MCPRLCARSVVALSLSLSLSLSLAHTKCSRAKKCEVDLLAE